MAPCINKKEQDKYKLQLQDMKDFSQQYFPRFGKHDWPLYMRFCIFMQKTDSLAVFPVLYYLNQGYRRFRKS